MVSEWKTKNIASVIKTSSGGTPSRQNPHFYEGDIPWVKTGELKNKYINDTKEHITVMAIQKSSAKLFPINSVLVAMYGATIGNCSILSVEASSNQACCAFLPNDEMHYEFLYYSLIFNKDKLVNLSSGAAQPNISQQIIKEFPISYPGYREQQKIAAILSSVDNAIEKTEQIIEQTEKVKKGLMQLLLTKGIGRTKFKKTAIGEIPEEWEIKEFKELMILQRGFDLPTQKRNQGDNPLLSANGITDYIDKYKVEGPGVITGRSGTIGKVHYITKNFWPLNTSLYVKEMYNNNPRFLYYFLANFMLERFATGTGVPTLNRNIVHKENIAVPPIDEQKRIADILTKIDEKVYDEIKFCNQLKKLKQALMQVLLTGKVRVPIDDAEVVNT